ncbi:hypothetical protein K3495_g13178 [Podosphaera aphanis]|nr:hypothetical protein K3495_g13178 [Podosphaera aphanis]
MGSYLPQSKDSVQYTSEAGPYSATRRTHPEPTDPENYRKILPEDQTTSRRTQNQQSLSLSKERDREEWTRISGGEESTRGQKEKGKLAAYQEWANTWPRRHRSGTLRHRPVADPETWKAAEFITDKTTGKRKVSFRGTPYSMHKTLKRAQSSIAMQIRSEHMGLKSYLYRRNVPGVENPSCPCGYLSQNVKHMIMACPLWSEGRTDIWRKAKNRSFEAMLNSPEDIGRITQWILDQGWIEQFRLAGEVEAQIKQREDLQKKGKKIKK